MQNKTESKKILSVILCIVLIAATALFTTGCQDTTTRSDEPSTAEAAVPTTEEISESAITTLGEGQTSFNLLVTDSEGNETAFMIRTDKTTVGEALLELELIAGEESEYGLYVKTVNGITADYNTDGTYWAFYINGEYASTGVDTTEIIPGNIYSLRVE